MSAAVDRDDPTNVAVIPSAYVGALGIARSLREVGWRGRVVCLSIDRPGRALTEEYPRLCETRRVALDDVADLLRWVRSAFPRAGRRALFLTDERFHPQLAGQERPDDGGVVFTTGVAKDIDTVCDRPSFYAFLSGRGLAATPKTIPSSEDPFAAFGDAFVLRMRRSWCALGKLPRGRMIRGEEQLRRAVRDLETRGIDGSEWVYQERLGAGCRDCVSVSGWHSSGVQDYLVTRSVAREPDETGCAVVVELFSPAPDLTAQARAVLSALEYCGPFELEFVRDARTGEFKVIELNPRFWMQHRLAARILGNVLVRRGLGEDVPRTRAARRPGLWVNGLWAARGLLRRWPKLVVWRRRGIVFEPPLAGTALRGAARRFARMAGGAGLAPCKARRTQKDAQ